MSKYTTTIAYLGVFTFLALMVQASPFAAEFLVSPTNIQGISVHPLTATQVDRKFITLFDRMGEPWKYFRPYVVVLSNQSQGSIDAVTLEWTVNDATGKTTTVYTTWEGYFNVVIQGLGPQRGGVRGRGGATNALILNRQAQLLMTPMECAPTTICGNSAGIGGSIGSGFVGPDGSPTYAGLELQIPPRNYVEELSRAAKVTVALDTVIFSDGLVKGPDRSKTVERFEARDAAARALAARALPLSDAEIRPLLLRLNEFQQSEFQSFDSPKSNEPNLKDFFTRGQARAAANATDPRQILTLYESLLPLPKFHR